jgi:hypothetical protein
LRQLMRRSIELIHQITQPVVGKLHRPLRERRRSKMGTAS